MQFIYVVYAIIKSVMGFFILIIIIWLIVLTVAFLDFKSYVLKRLKTLDNGYDSIQNTPLAENIKSEDNNVESFDALFDKDGIKKTDFEINNAKKDNVFKIRAENKIKDIESLFFGNIFNKIGAVILIIAFGIFLKFISQYIEFTPLLKIIFALLSGFGMVSGAVYLFRIDKMRNYAAVLMGAGFGVLFLTVYFAFALYQMLNNYMASFVAILLLLFAYFIAKKYKSISTFIIGLIGAYLAPVIIGSTSIITVNYLFSYLIFVNLISMVYVSKDNEKTPFNYANMLLTCLFVHIWSIKGGNPLIILPFILWAAYLLFDMLLIKLMPKNKTYLCWVNFAVMSSFLILNYFDNEKYMVSFGTILIGIIYLFCAGLIKKYSTESALQYKNGAVFALYAAIWFIPSYILKMFSFAILGALVSFLSGKREYLQKWGFAYIISAFLMVFSTGALFSNDITEFLNYRYIFNERILFYIIPSISAISISRLCKKFPAKLSDILYLFGISFCYLFVATEINILVLKLQNADISNNSFEYVRNISYVILGIIYSLQLTHFRKILSLQSFSYIGYVAFVLSSATLILLSFFIPDSLYYPVINIRTFAIIFAIMVSIFYKLKERVDYFGYLAVFFGFLLLNLECYKILELYNSSDLGIITTSLWMLYAGILIISGIFANIKICKMSGIFIVVMGLLKIFIIDISGVEAIYKILAFFITGIILMIVSYCYAKYKKD